MEKVREWLKSPLYVGIGAGVLGLIIGWIVIGWGLWPVTYFDAAPVNLRADLKVDYMRMSIDSFSKNQDSALAKKRYADLGPDAPKLLNDIRTTPGKSFPDDIVKFSNALTGVAQPLLPAATLPAGQATLPAGQATLPAGQATLPAGQATLPAAQPTKVPAVVAPTVTPTVAPADGGSSLGLLLVLCLVLLVIGGAVAFMLIKGNRKGGFSLSNLIGGGKSKGAQPAQPVYPPQGSEAPIAQFMTTYKLGVDMYDDSFSIDSPTGEFLGECGVGISKHIGVGDPKKVTAFEVWLFDKNDIQTVTKVLMSEHAINDPAIQQELMAKGEPVPMVPGAEILLQTATLQLQARVVDMNYGQGALPQNSFFDRLTLELAIWPKPTA